MDFVKSQDGVNKKYHRETLLNYGLNRWKLNQASSVGKTSELIRKCSPSTLQEWEDFYFNNAFQSKKDGIQITQEYITELGKTLYIKLSEVVHNELSSITEEECIDYVYNLIINRTYDDYMTEINTIYEQLEKILNVKIKPAPDEWDRKYNVDFYIEISKNCYIGLQIKPITGKSLNDYQWSKMHEENHKKFKEKFNGSVFFVFSEKESGKKKKISNTEVIDALLEEINKLSNANKS